VLEVDLPFADRDDVDLLRRADELLLRVGPYRRAIVLPDSLRRRTVAGARIDDGCLGITFADSAETAGEADMAEGAASAGTAGPATPDMADEPRAPEPAAVR
jgi:arsenite-transporting ATPase